MNAELMKPLPALPTLDKYDHFGCTVAHFMRDINLAPTAELQLQIKILDDLRDFSDRYAKQ